jgi:hypothetical protein
MQWSYISSELTPAFEGVQLESAEEKGNIAPSRFECSSSSYIVLM